MISKITLLLFLVPFLGEFIMASQTWEHFFWDTLYLSCKTVSSIYGFCKKSSDEAK